MYFLSKCSVTCGTGFQTRQVECYSNNQKDIPTVNSNCDVSKRPALRQECNIECQAEPKWVIVGIGQVYSRLGFFLLLSLKNILPLSVMLLVATVGNTVILSVDFRAMQAQISANETRNLNTTSNATQAIVLNGNSVLGRVVQLDAVKVTCDAWLYAETTKETS